MGKDEPQKFDYESMGTHWEITVWDELDRTKFEHFQQEILSGSQQFDQTYSRFIKNSLVWELTKKTGVLTVPEDFMSMLKWYKKFFKLSGGKVNPLIGFSISDLGYDADYTLIPKKTIRPTPDFDATVKILDNERIEILEPVLIDLGALGKGYYVDKIADYLRSKGMNRFLVNGSGDIFYQGNGTPIRAGLEHPGDPTKVIGVVEMKQGGMCASGINRRKWDKYNHVIDPHSLSSPEEILATWVIADSTVIS